MEDILQALNEPQRQAVVHKDGPLMIIAGAGSGKTKVLTTRIAHLMANGVDAFNILALTFTNKAAAEMKERIEKILGNSEARNLFIGTFHSVFARILRVEAARLGYPTNFSIYDADDSRSLIKSIVQELKLDEKLYKPSTIHNRISGAKNTLVTPQAYAVDFYIQKEDNNAHRPATAAIYAAYAEKCFRNGAMDFDDLLLKMYELLNNHPEALLKYQRKFKYVLIDEYQDTNTVQYQIAKLLAAMHENICVVGDDAQSIYSFRGATIQNILEFQKDYDDVCVIKLEQNYRSTQTILEVANEVIKKNKGQLPKSLWTENSSGEKIRLTETYSDNEEGKYVADTIQEQKLRNHFYNRDFAILYRTNAQSRAFEESLRRQGIPYKIYGGTSFYQRKEIKDILAYLRIIVNPNDEEALKRIINYPVRGIGKTTIEKALIIAHQNDISFFKVLEQADIFGFKGNTFKAIEAFVVMIHYFQTLLSTQNAYDIAQEVGKRTQLIKELFNDKTTEGLARYENIQELLNAIKGWVESPDTEEGEVENKSLGRYLQEISLLTDVNEEEENPDVVKLMTIHSAKGLEFECVFLGGLEENIFPSGMSVHSREELEEERRLFYVAITRSKQKLWLLYSQTRYRFGNLEHNQPSRFLKEIPEVHLDKKVSHRNQSHFAPSQRPAKSFATQPTPKTPTTGVYSFLSQSPAQKAHTPSENFEASDLSQLEVGNKVEHQKFGFGIVKTIEGSAHNPVAMIDFENSGEKKIMLQYAKLSIVS